MLPFDDVMAGAHGYTPAAELHVPAGRLCTVLEDDARVGRILTEEQLTSAWRKIGAEV
jgi:hypothetical protein